MHWKLWMVMIMTFAVGCQPEVEEIRYGRDSCIHCRMTISDRRYGGELVTQKGRVFKFDAVECMLEYKKENESNYAFRMAVAYDKPGALQPVDCLAYLISSNLPSPMGAFLTAFSTPALAREFQEEKGGELYDWTGLERKFTTN